MKADEQNQISIFLKTKINIKKYLLQVKPGSILINL